MDTMTQKTTSHATPARIIKISLLFFTIALLSFSASAHPGRTDDSGGHHDSSTGEYHYHHGHSAHQHEDLDGDGLLECPYNFDDQTGSHSGSISSSAVASGENSPLSNLPGIVCFLIVIFVVISASAILSFVLALVCVLIDKNKKRPKR